MIDKDELLIDLYKFKKDLEKEIDALENEIKVADTEFVKKIKDSCGGVAPEYYRDFINDNILKLTQIRGEVSCSCNSRTLSLAQKELQRCDNKFRNLKKQFEIGSRRTNRDINTYISGYQRGKNDTHKKWLNGVASGVAATASIGLLALAINAPISCLKKAPIAERINQPAATANIDDEQIQ